MAQVTATIASKVGLQEHLELLEGGVGAVGVGGQGDDVTEAGAQGHHTEDGRGVNRSAALLGNGDRDALLGDRP